MKATTSVDSFGRGRWSVENSRHGVLDIAFGEADRRIGKDQGPENMAALRHMALKLLKQAKSSKVGIKSKRKNAGWDEGHLLQVHNG
jgi:predicted transposase YbfD/YdcC